MASNAELNKQAFDNLVRQRIALQRFVKSNVVFQQLNLESNNEDMHSVLYGFLHKIKKTPSLLFGSYAEVDDLFNGLEKNIATVRSPFYRDLSVLFTKDIKDLANLEAKEAIANIELLRQKGIKLSASRQKAMIDDILNNAKFAGVSIADRVSVMFESDTKRLKTEMYRAINGAGGVTNNNINSIIDSVIGTEKMHWRDGVTRSTFNDIARNFSTVANGVANTVNAESNFLVKDRDPLDDVIFERFSAILDSKVCLQCAGLDGLVYELGQGVFPPMHDACRCIRVPQLGTGTDKPKDKLPTFEIWFANQSESYKEGFLGKDRYKLYQKKEDISVFSTHAGDIRTIEELKKIYNLK